MCLPAIGLQANSIGSPNAIGKDDRQANAYVDKLPCALGGKDAKVDEAETELGKGDAKEIAELIKVYKLVGELAMPISFGGVFWNPYLHNGVYVCWLHSPGIFPKAQHSSSHLTIGDGQGEEECSYGTEIVCAEYVLLNGDLQANHDSHESERAKDGVSDDEIF